MSAAPASAELSAALLAASEHLGARRAGAIDWQGQVAFAKRTGLQRRRDRWLATLGALLVRVFWRSGPATAPRRAGDVPIEVQRLRELAAAGVRVPQVLAWGEGIFVMTSAGTPLEHVLAATPDPRERLQLLRDTAIELAQLHQRGQWHGGAQCRNLAVTPEGLVRFDFDLDLDRYFALPVLQAFDALLWASSVVGLTDADAATALVRTYLDAAPEAARAAFARSRWLVDRLAASWLLRVWMPKEAHRVQGIAAVLDGAAGPEDG